MLMPLEYALITQFVAFNFLYFADARATVRGWCPPWYSTYRFVLTFFVGASIVISLIGRGQIASKDGRLPGPADKMKELRDSQWANLEREEKERRKQLAKEEEEAQHENEEEEEASKDGDDKDGSEDEGAKKDEKKDEKEDEKEEKDEKKDGNKDKKADGKDDGKDKDNKNQEKAGDGDKKKK